MPMGSHPVLWGLSASLAAVAWLAACGGNGPTSGRTTTSGTSTPTTTTTARLAVSTTTDAAAAPATQPPRTGKWIDLQVGDCLADLPPTDPSVVTVTIVDCATAHQAEVYFRASMAVNAANADVANRECAGGFSQYTGRPLDGSPYAVTYLIDYNQDRTSSNPAPSAVICLLYAASGQPLRESARR